jgi:penicillin V acylase-like amidase (Ntn superfamily)
MVKLYQGGNIMRIMSKRFMTSVLLVFALSLLIGPASACTGVMLRGDDGTVVRGRTRDIIKSCG